ncbi:MAG: YdcF family protein [Pseudomonadota bacterium]
MRVAIVLGAAVRPDGTPSGTLRLRTSHAVALWQSDRVHMICLTGGVGRHGPAEAEVAADVAHAMGVPREKLLLETQSTTTVENLALARALLPPGAQIVVVTNRWHGPRAWVAARLLGLRAQLDCPPGTLSWPRTLLAIAREGVALPLTILRCLRQPSP